MPMACSCAMTVAKSRRAVLVIAISIAVVIVMMLRVSTGPIFMSPSSVKNSKSFTLKHKSSSRHNGNSSTSKGYIITDHFRGQQGGSTRAVLSLQCWAASFSLPVRIVDPYIGIRQSRDKMSKLFDLEHFNAVSQETREPLIATWEEFSKQSPRDVIVVEVSLKLRQAGCKSALGLFSKELDVNDSNASTSSYSVANEEECLNLKQVGMKVPVLEKFNYCIKRVVTELSVECCSRFPNEYKEMSDIIYRGRDATKFTVVFTWWSAMCECQNPDSSYHMNCSDPLKQKFKNKLTTSKQLLSPARYYTEHFLHSQNKVAVMIRSEQAVLRFREKGSKIEFLRDCLQRTINITHNISETNSHKGKTGILLTTDVGRFGTLTGKSMNKKMLEGRLQEMIELAFARIYGDEWTFEEYEKSFTVASKGNESPVYIAALQRTLASQADCLILMGGGNFQLLTLNDYLDKHPNPCVHFVCLDEYYEEVTRLVMQRNYNI